MKICIPDDYQDAVRKLDCFSALSGHDVTIFTDTVTDQSQLAERFADAEALVLIRERTVISDALLDRLPRLRLISQTGGGISHIDVAACRARGITVCAGTGSPYAPAELTWALILASARRIPQEAASLRAGAWQTGLGTTLRNRLLAIWGFGKIGSIVAGYGRAFGMKVVAFGREGSLQRARAAGVAFASTKEELLAAADVLTLHLRLNSETAGIVTRTDLARMKKSSLFVNTSRAELVERGALVEALEKGRPGFAAVDVYEREPVVGATDPLVGLPNALCTPHLGYVEKDSYELYFGQAFAQVNAFAAGTPVNVVS